MARSIVAGLPPGLVLGAGCVIRFNAISAEDGSAVTGVTITNATIMIRNVGAAAADQVESGPFLLVPGPGA